MPSIEILRKYASKPSSREWKDERVYIAANGARAVFKNPFEFHMGAYSWDLELLDRGLNKLGSKSGLLCPDSYEPWCSDSACLFLNSVKEGSFIYEIESALTRKCDLRGVVGCIGSQRFTQYLVITVEGGYLVGRDGRTATSIAMRRPPHGFPFLSWFDDAGLFFAVETQWRGLANLRFFGAETANSLRTEPLNPNSLFPYDEVSYQDLDRNSYTLVLSASSQCAGFLLDEWSSIEFDAKTSILRMMVYRPVAEIFEKRSMRVCEVEERWVEARLNP
jgi:hypothetical protein